MAFRVPLRKKKKDQPRSASVSANSPQSSTTRSSVPRSSQSGSHSAQRPSRPRVQIQSPDRDTHTDPVPETSSSSLPREDRLLDEEDGLNDLDVLNEIIMAVDMKERGTVGCCYYVARDEKLYFMEDVKLGGVEIVDQCKCRLFQIFQSNLAVVRLYVDPTLILVSTKIDDTVIDRLDPEARNRDSISGNSRFMTKSLIGLR